MPCVSFALHIFLWYFSADFQANFCTKSAEKSQRPRMDIDKKIMLRKDLNEISENHHSFNPKNHFHNSDGRIFFCRAKSSKFLNSDLKSYCQDQNVDLIETVTYTK